MLRKDAPVRTQLTGQNGFVTDQRWLQVFQETRDYYNQVLKYTDPYNAEFGKNEPPHKIGLLAYADGTNWNPSGSGTVGYFRWSGSAWTFVG